MWRELIDSGSDSACRVRGDGGRRIVLMMKSGADLVTHRRRNISAGVENAPDIHDVIADDVEHQVGETSQRPNAEARNLEFVRELEAARLR